MRHLLAVSLLLFASTAFGQTVKLPPEVKVPVGRLATVTVEYDGDAVKWDVPPELDCFREYDEDAKKVRLRLIGYAPGTYRLLAVAAKGGKLSDFAVCNIVVGDPKPPTPPDPVDPLTKTLQAAFDGDTDVDRAKSLAFLQAAYAAMAKLAPSLTTVKTNADALAWMKSIVQAPGVGLTPAQVVKLRTTIGVHLQAAWGKDMASLELTAMAMELDKVAKALSGVK